MPVYEYECCGVRFDAIRRMDDRDTVSCSHCKSLAKRVVSSFNIGNTTYVADNLAGVSNATGIKNIDTIRAADRALSETGTVPVDAYYRPPKPPPLKEVTMEELAPYIDNMPLYNEPI